MGGIKYSAHPLFFAVGVYYALTGRIFVFLIYAFTAVLHEIGHSLAAARAGYKLNKITLTPFGATVTGNIEGLKFYDELSIAAAGPLLNLAVGLLFVAFWWIFPETYAFTDTAAEANFAIALVNFIPAYPLDGGRILSALLSIKIGERRAAVVCKIIGVALACALLSGFIYTAFDTPNISLLIFGLFVLVGALDRRKENAYIRIASVLTADKLLRGIPVKRQAVSKSVTLKNLIKILDLNAVNELDVYDGERKMASISQKRLTEILKNGNIYSKIGDYI